MGIPEGPSLLSKHEYLFRSGHYIKHQSRRSQKELCTTDLVSSRRNKVPHIGHKVSILGGQLEDELVSEEIL